MSESRDARSVDRAFEKQFGIRDSYVQALNRKEATEAR